MTRQTTCAETCHRRLFARLGQRCQPGNVAQGDKLPATGNLQIWATWSNTGAVPALALDERAILDGGMDRLAELLGPDFEVTPYHVAGEAAGDEGVDGIYTVRATVGSAPYAQVVVEAKASLTPAAAKDVLLPQVRLLQQLYRQATVLVIAPWLSPRTRVVLSERQVSYLDLTGNVDLRLPTGVLIKTEGAQRDPGSPSHRRSRGLSGASAGIVARLLVDFVPPYRAKELAAVAGVSPGYLSRLLRTLDDEALIRRERADIVEVVWPDLLRARSEQYNLLRSNHVTLTAAPKGADAVYRQLMTQGSECRAVVTGSYAAREVAPVAVGGSLMLYVSGDPNSVDDALDEFSLLPAAGGSGNVVLLHPTSTGPFQRTRSFGASEHVGLSQLVIDCLSGTGRMPAEGEAVLSHMLDAESVWRRAPGELSRQASGLS